MKDNSLEKELYRYGLIFLLLGAVLVGVYIIFLYPYLKSLECFFYQLTGFYCPGCGGTRSVIALMHGKILKSLWYHPFVLYAGLMYTWFILSHTFERFHWFGIKGMRFHNWYLAVGIMLLAGNWVFKNILLHVFHIAM